MTEPWSGAAAAPAVTSAVVAVWPTSPSAGSGGAGGEIAWYVGYNRDDRVRER